MPFIDRTGHGKTVCNKEYVMAGLDPATHADPVEQAQHAGHANAAEQRGI